MNNTGQLIIDSPLQMNQRRTFFRLSHFVNANDLLLKLEGLNPAGSIKIKPALYMISALEKSGKLNPQEHSIIESSSGSLGIALSLVCKVKGYKFICVTDPNINEVSKKYIKLYGAELIIVNKRDENGGFLNTRIKLIKDMIKNDSNLIWLNQYASENNVLSHFNETAEEIFSSFKSIDYLFVGVGTSGTIMGCINYINSNKLNTKVIAIDAQGSVSFGFPSQKRLIPGIGTSRKPEILDTGLIKDVILTPEKEAIQMCHDVLNKYGLLIGGSTGSVLAGVKKYQESVDLSNSKLVAVSPDFGDRYIDTIYNESWVDTHFSEMTIE